MEEMTSMYSEMRDWVERNYSNLRQFDFNGSVCDNFPSESRTSMIATSDVSAEDYLERGMAIKGDLTTGDIFRGTRTRVHIPRPKGTIGTFHTHPYGFAIPSGHDLMDAIVKNDKVACIGATGMVGTKVACYTPKEPDWNILREELLWLRNDIRNFNETMRLKYRDEDPSSETYGQALRGNELRAAMGREALKVYAELIGQEYRDEAGNLLVKEDLKKARAKHIEEVIAKDENIQRLNLEKRGRELKAQVLVILPVHQCKVVWETRVGEKEYPDWFEKLTEFHEEREE